MDSSTLGPSDGKEPAMGMMTRRVSEKEGTRWRHLQARKELQGAAARWHMAGVNM